jgi:hypothetical protein
MRGVMPLQLAASTCAPACDGIAEAIMQQYVDSAQPEHQQTIAMLDMHLTSLYCSCCCWCSSACYVIGATMML